MTRNCTRCGETKPIEQFHRHGERGRRHVCGTCANAQKAARSLEVKRAERQRWRARHPEKRAAHRAVKKAVDRGKLVKPEACERCAVEGPVQAHHEDYDRRFDVMWLCGRCHVDEHLAATG